MNRHRDSERSTGKEQMKNQEWYCTSSVIALSSIVFNTSINRSRLLVNELTCASTRRTTHTKRERGITSLISSLTKQVANAPNKSTMIADLIKNCAQEKTEKVEYYPVSHQDSEMHAEQNGNLERHEVSKIEHCVQCQKCSRYS